MSLYLCVDCGGSKAAAVIADSSCNVVARALGGPSNFAYLGLAPFLAVVQETVEKALRECQVSTLKTELPGHNLPLSLPPPAGHPYFTAAWLGVSGCDSPAAVAVLTPAVEALLGVTTRIANDTHLLAAPMKLYPDVTGAVAVVAGTGGIVVSFRETTLAMQRVNSGGEIGAAASSDIVGLEELGRVGGWGWILGDEGGGFHVGREAVRQVLEEADRASIRQRTTGTTGAPEFNGKLRGLKNRILHRFGVDDVHELLTIIHLPDPVALPTPASPAPTPNDTASPNAVPAAEPNPILFPREKRLSSLSPLVFAAAFEDRDPLALKVLQAASSALVDQICILLKGEKEESEGRTIRASESILCLGGSLSGVDSYRALILDELKRRGFVFKRVEVVNDAAAVGARALALGMNSQKM
ncbi:uncharacterized protein LAESUDRAFT_720678 [Laetiporus sulphureus 93-53]|uniref:N-acetylglucosamine kinase n=1 Tax=Laetiporus sulphureus 93-53 TaxID=1314785 RepID=A0A165H9Y8_9APHY|nr:uncharacterized protein LAESUDRAFT_720678 [Laetiporus sulphureus 93-53]KZT11446.1 hypothetical protein LAESUDRAFT_720678 [Laetiporus sulphureus 93-53]